MTRKCCCFDAKSGTFIGATFTLTVSAMQFLLILSLYGGFGLAFVFGNDSGDPYYTSLTMYVGLAIFDVIIVVISAATLNGNEKGHRMVLLAWIILMGIYILFEAGINITFFILNFESYLELLQLAGNLTVISLIIYWVIKVIVYIACMYAVGHRWADLDDDKEPMRIGRRMRMINSPLSLPAEQPIKRQVRVDTGGGDRIRIVNMADGGRSYAPQPQPESVVGETVMYQPGTQMYTGVGVVGEGLYGGAAPSTLSAPRVLSYPANSSGQYALQI